MGQFCLGAVREKRIVSEGARSKRKSAANALTKGHEKDRDEPADIESGLLEFYQDLLEARQAGDAEYAMKKLRLLPALLEREGIQTGSKDVETSVCDREAIVEERHCGRTEEIKRPRTASAQC